MGRRKKVDPEIPQDTLNEDSFEELFDESEVKIENVEKVIYPENNKAD